MIGEGERDVGTVVRDYREGDAEPLARLFYDAVHETAVAKYTAAQVDAWAPRVPDAESWAERMRGHHTLVAERAGVEGPRTRLRPVRAVIALGIGGDDGAGQGSIAIRACPVREAPEIA